MEVWQLAEAVTLRPEAFGGMAFHRERGITLEVDTEAYRFLCAYLQPRPLPSPNHPAARLVPQLTHLSFICPANTNWDQPTLVPDTPWLGDDLALSAPETIHLAITTRCNLSCPGCYVPHPDAGIGPELTVAELRELIDQWAQMRVFQLAVGGGEPLLYDGLFDVLTYARERGIVPNLTTNGTLLSTDVIRHLVWAGVGRVNLSWNGPDNRHRGRGQSAMQALRMLLNSTLRVGVNLLVTPTLLPHLSQTLARLQTLGIQGVTILRPKPPAISSKPSIAWYNANRLRRADLLRLRTILNGWQGVLRIEVDSALVSLMGDANPTLLRQRGIHGCTAGRRICTIWPDGRVTPCSFLADLSVGNVRQTPFAELWERGENWGVLRDPTIQLQGSCANCDIASQCGGARCVARHEHGDLFAGDIQCPHYLESVE
ncbi:MAG: radical SAM protein [Chloroflexi bacterium]|nr:radical SAM protein [Chloroflexota bacterium]